ncbi:MAG TPA: hypothetical protein PKC54_04100 [Ferruginibacter sp.]|nr:hypothetical protein [Ferruginibacter sp.]
MKQLFFSVALFLSIVQALSQNPDCKVLADSLKGTYEGGCKSGKADGKGKASGTDVYEGEFKSGLPDGKGKYNWKNGDVYEGNFKKGLKEGYGELRKSSGNQDSVLTGFWKKDIYKGRYEKPYMVHNTTSEVSRVEVNKTGNADKTITVSVTLLTGGGNRNTRDNKTVMVMTDVQIIKGVFLYKASSTISNKDVTIFRGVDFPFRARFYFGNASVDVEIFEAGEWDILVPIL